MAWSVTIVRQGDFDEENELWSVTAEKTSRRKVVARLGSSVVGDEQQAREFAAELAGGEPAEITVVDE